MSARRVGALIAATLEGSWRESCAAAEGISAAELERIAPHLRRGASAALASRRLRGTALSNAPAAAMLQHEYRLQALRCAAFEERIEYLFDLFGTASIDAMLLKGRASAAYYARPELRPYGDIDILVPPRDSSARKRSCVTPRPARSTPTCTTTSPTSRPQLRRTARPLAADQRRHEPHPRAGGRDHLAHITLHFFRHLAWRSAWLCDVAAALERFLKASTGASAPAGTPCRRNGSPRCSRSHASCSAPIRTICPLRARSATPALLLRNTLYQWGRADDDFRENRSRAC